MSLWWIQQNFSTHFTPSHAQCNAYSFAWTEHFFPRDIFVELQDNIRQHAIYIRQWHVMAFNETRCKPWPGHSMHLHLWGAENTNIIKKKMEKRRSRKEMGNDESTRVHRSVQKPPKLRFFLLHITQSNWESSYWLKNVFILNIWLDTSFRHDSSSLQRKWLRNGRVQTIVEGQSHFRTPFNMCLCTCVCRCVCTRSILIHLADRRNYIITIMLLITFVVAVVTGPDRMAMKKRVENKRTPLYTLRIQFITRCTVYIARTRMHGIYQCGPM